MEDLKQIEKVVSKDIIKYNEPMSSHTTMNVGGNAKIFIEPTNVDEIRKVISYAKSSKIDYYLLGKGSNMVVSDDGIDGIVIKISNKFSDIKIEGDSIIASSGVSMPLISVEAKKHGLTGLEFACGIPGTIGRWHQNECRCI